MKLVKIFLMWILFFQITITQNNENKHVIGSFGYGFFSCFLAVLNHLDWCHRNNKIPVVYWVSRSLYYVPAGFNGNYNVWEYYFEPVSSLQYEPGDYISEKYSPEHEIFYYGKIEQYFRDKAHNVIEKYIRINVHVQNKIDQFYQQNMQGKKTIGIHLRGTDKAREVSVVPIERIIDAALENADQDTQFLIASDEQKLFNKAIELLRDKKVIYYDCFRSINGIPLHHLKDHSPAKLAEDVLVEVSLLAKCQALVHTFSNVSTAVLYFNPVMKDIVLR